ncbi:fumarylacetoacetate hydrolase family protein [Pseudoclavibacter sp. VKM Ac-2888]|uniref:fumarylacetoacetate hydrolase family protein n=1 Tax=Pseudoclavibacter sp. VKM Ac-2888 TaxID=2783830 RepID=UPI00188D8A9C|nr:fumarylacetoacetate hydrolase family protein [Pseudoclavibacter sp. VKM Ac-2888]MBF4551617.1 fumarylacetoacetate hydrolase family protein [Pseudoclavibacter sp. VKM Ac-2888]
MRYARWMHDGSAHDGIVVAHEGGDRLLAFADGLTVLGATRLGLERANAAATSLIERARADGSLGLAPSVSDVELLAPIEAPSVRDFVAFEEHVEGVVKSIDGDSGVVAEWYDAPTFYFTNPHSLVGSGASIRPPVTERLDFELEVAVIVGAVDVSDGANLDEASAAGHVFGYSVFNDWSARDIQSREMKVRLGPCKGKDFAATLGPWIVTADELSDAHDADGFLELELQVLVNGELIGSDLLSNMGWSFPQLLVYASRNSRVVPGDVLGSGTAGNGGCLAELWGRAGSLTPPPLAEGDVVELRVERIGEVSNVIGAAVEAVPVPRARAASRARTRGRVSA